jgi:hypothetical protein
MRRRDFIKAIAVSAWPLAARAQQSEKIRLVGVLFGTAEKEATTEKRLAAFRDGLAALGWIEDATSDSQSVGLAATSSECAPLRRSLSA